MEKSIVSASQRWCDMQLCPDGPRDGVLSLYDVEFELIEADLRQRSQWVHKRVEQANSTDRMIGIWKHVDDENARTMRTCGRGDYFNQFWTFHYCNFHCTRPRAITDHDIENNNCRSFPLRRPHTLSFSPNQQETSSLPFSVTVTVT